MSMTNKVPYPKGHRLSPQVPSRPYSQAYHGMIFWLLGMTVIFAFRMGLGVEIGGSISTEISWTPDEGVLLSSELGGSLAFDSLSTSTRLTLRDGALEKVVLDMRWYALPLRASGRATFDSVGFKEGVLELAYWARPWSGKLKGKLSAADPFQLEFEGAYDGDIVAQAYLALSGAFSFQKAELGMTLPLAELGRISGALKFQAEAEPSLITQWGTSTPWGDLLLELQNFRFSSLELSKEWAKEGEEHELEFLLSWEESVAWELYYKSTFYLTESSDYSLAWKLRQSELFELRSVTLSGFAPGWKLVFKPLSQEITVEWWRSLGVAIQVGGSLHWAADYWEGSFWIRGVLGELEWEAGMELEDFGLEEVYLELYCKF